MRTCGHCGKSVEGKRANATWCSASCRVMGARARKSFPVEMRSVPSWVRFRLAPRGNGKLAKVPIQTSGRNASTTNPATWNSFLAVSRATVGDGLGWVLSNGIGCIDLDDCIEDGVLSEFGRGLVDHYRGEAILIERSLSGRGVHIFLPMEPGPGHVLPGMEIYPPDSGRFIALTGDRI